MKLLPTEEYVEQSYLFRTVAERLGRSESLQDILKHVREEVLATTQLPYAIDYLRAELNHGGAMAPAMRKLAHYFTPFQTFLVNSAEDDRGRFDLRMGLLSLHHEVSLRSAMPEAATLFFFQFETLCRCRLDYDKGLGAMAQDPAYDEPWRNWIGLVRRQVGLIDLADLVYVNSQYYVDQQRKREAAEVEIPEHVLFGIKEGRIALANRRKDPLFLFEALQRQLSYPKVPKVERQLESPQEMITKMSRRLERMEARMKLLEEEQREAGIDLSKFYQANKKPPFPDEE